MKKYQNMIIEMKLIHSSGAVAGKDLVPHN